MDTELVENHFNSLEVVKDLSPEQIIEEQINGEQNEEQINEEQNEEQIIPNLEDFERMQLARLLKLSELKLEETLKIHKTISEFLYLLNNGNRDNVTLSKLKEFIVFVPKELINHIERKSKDRSPNYEFGEDNLENIITSYLNEIIEPRLSSTEKTIRALKPSTKKKSRKKRVPIENIEPCLECNGNNCKVCSVMG